MPPTDNNGLAAQLVQLAPTIKGIIDRIKPVVDQPIIRFPYTLASAKSFTVGAGVQGARVPSTDFSHSLEWPFEVWYTKFSNDPSHTFRDWRVNVQDQSFNQDWMKTITMVDLLVKTNTSSWDLPFPWIVRPKGGGLFVNVDNLDMKNPITVDIDFVGFLLMPRV